MYVLYALSLIITINDRHNFGRKYLLFNQMVYSTYVNNLNLILFSQFLLVNFYLIVNNSSQVLYVRFYGIMYPNFISIQNNISLTNMFSGANFKMTFLKVSCSRMAIFRGKLLQNGCIRRGKLFKKIFLGVSCFRITFFEDKIL